MSFSGDVKKELLNTTGNARHCQIAELAAVFEYFGYLKTSERDTLILGYATENKAIATKYFTLLKKTFNIDFGVLVRKASGASKIFTYELRIEDAASAKNVLMAFKKYTDAGMPDIHSPVNPLLLKKDCCRRAFIRGSYLAIGSMSNPEKGYHMEFVCDKEPMAQLIIDTLKTFSIEAKMVLRKKYYVVYLKDGEAIVDMLNLMGAHISLMELENTRIVKDVRNSINRRVNCEAANIKRTVNAANKQVEDILYIQSHYGLQKLPMHLSEIAEIRLSYPDASLAEIAGMMDPPVGKSGVNHRLRKLSELAERLRTD